MLYPTLNQPVVFIVIFLTGFASGFLFDLANFLSVFFARNKIITQLLLCFSTFLASFLLFFANLLINYGNFRIFIVTAFLLAFCLQRFSIGSLTNKAYAKILPQKNKKPKTRHKKIKTKKS